MEKMGAKDKAEGGKISKRDLERSSPKGRRKTRNGKPQ